MNGRPGADGEALRATLTVAAVARRLGVAPATLRTWDRRYGLGPSQHQAGSHRRYSAADVARLLIMRRLTLEGAAPADAAAVARDSDVNDSGASVTLLSARTPTPPPHGVPHGVVPPGADPLPRPVGQPVAGRAPVDGPRLVDVGTAERAARGLARAAASLDADDCRRIIRRYLDREGTVVTWEKVIAPVLAQLGEKWAATGEGVEVEHLLSECIVDALHAVTASFRNFTSARPVVLAGAENEQHGLPLHVLAAALAERGMAVRLFGVRVPGAALSAAVRRIGPGVVFVYAHVTVTNTASVDELPRLRPSPLVLLGGPGWTGVVTPPGAERVLGLAEAVARIERAIGF